jgi:hypothetical protein
MRNLSCWAEDMVASLSVVALMFLEASVLVLVLARVSQIHCNIAYRRNNNNNRISFLTVASTRH